MIRIGAKGRGEKIERQTGREGLILELERQVKEARRFALESGFDWVTEPAYKSWPTVYSAPRP